MAALGAEFVGFAVAGAACCCIGGSALFLREYNSAYTAVAMHEATEDEDEDYDDTDEIVAEEEVDVDEDFVDLQQQAPPVPPPGQEIFAIDDDALTPEGCLSTPTGPVLSASSSNWVEEMNAELADFDAAQLSLKREATPSGTTTSAWRQQMQAELSPPPSSGR